MNIAILILGIAVTVPFTGYTISVERVSTDPSELLVSEPEIRTAVVTAYSSEVNQTDDTPNLTAAQTETRQGVIACPRELPFGTIVEVEGKRYVCEDRMHPRFNDRFDIWVESTEKAFEWGKQVKEVKIYEQI